MFNKFFQYHTWNIGFVEQPVEQILVNEYTDLTIHWLKHSYKDLFFADPFLLSVDEKYIQVLVEEFPYYKKKGVISLLTIDKQYNLLSKKTICNQPYHQSYPFILRFDNEIRVIPEASQSGALYSYRLNIEKGILEDKQMLINEPLLDSTIVYKDGLWWLFATKRGANSNKDLFIYYSENPLGGYNLISQEPVKKDLSGARPAGYVVNIDGDFYRVVQVCEHSYGEAVRIYKINILTKQSFEESFVKEIRLTDSIYSEGFHTLNGLQNLCVVDGLREDKVICRKILNELKNKIGK